MTGLFVTDLRSCPAEQWLQLLPTLPEARRQRASDCRREADRLRLIAAGWLLQHVLEQAGIPAAQQQIALTPYGKPVLPQAPQHHISLSHSGPWVVCALSGTAVGVDVEQARCSAAVAQRYFHREELAFAGDPTSLCRLWTAKEAFIKALGVGLTIPLNSFVVRLGKDGAALEQSHSPLPYRLHEYALEDCRMCLCTVDDRPAPVFVRP